jgi:transposase
VGGAGAAGGGLPSASEGATATLATDDQRDLWRHENGAKWRALPEEYGPWWMAAQIFIRWSRLGVWERLLALVQERGVELGMTFLDGTSIRAHQKADGAAKKAPLRRNGTCVRRLAALVAATAPRPS